MIFYIYYKKNSMFHSINTSLDSNLPRLRQKIPSATGVARLLLLPQLLGASAAISGRWDM